MMRLSGTELWQSALGFGRASTILSTEGSLRGLADLPCDLDHLRRAEALSKTEGAALDHLLQNGVSPRFPASQAIDLLSSLEGKLLGRAVAARELPVEGRSRWSEAVAGRVDVTAEGVLEAHRRIRMPWIVPFLRELGHQPFGAPHHVRRTRIEHFRALEEVLERPVYLKHEDEQYVGSFKNRGATNFLVHALLAGHDPRTVTVGTASHGNHAQGVVQAAHNLGIRNVEVLLPKNASPLKIAQLKELGARVELFGDTFEECADEVARRAARDPNYLFLPAFDQPLVVMGQGTVGVEIAMWMAIHGHEDYSVLVPAGGGGLLSGIATYLNQHRRCVEEGAQAPVIDVRGVESKAHPYVSRSVDLRKIAEPDAIKHIDTVADGIALLKIGRAGFQGILDYVTSVASMPERTIEATLAFLHENGLTLEGAAATPVAAMLFGVLSFPAEQPVVIVASGRNIDGELLAAQVAAYGEGRWRRLREDFARLRKTLTLAGFLANGAVVPLAKPKDGIAFVDAVVHNLPEGWDLLDALELFDYGPWTDKKGINGTLRSLGQFRARWNGDKEASLVHPESDRGRRLERILSLVSGGTSLQDSFGTFRLENVDRLEVEIHVMDVFLGRSDWLERLRPEMLPQQRDAHFSAYRDRNATLRQAVGRIRTFLSK